MKSIFPLVVVLITPISFSSLPLTLIISKHALDKKEFNEECLYAIILVKQESHALPDSLYSRIVRSKCVTLSLYLKKVCSIVLIV